MPADFTSKRLSYLALIVGLFSIGFAAILVSLAKAPGPVSAFYRMAVAAVLILIPFLRQTTSRGKPYPWQGVRLALFGGLLFALDVAFWTTGITISGAATPTLMANTAPIWVGLGSMLIFHERLNALFWFGLILAMFGALLVLGAEFTRGAALGWGTFLGLLAAIFYGAYYLVTQRGRVYLNTLSYFWITTCTAAVVLLILNLIVGNPITGYSLQTYLAFLGLGLIAQILGWLTINYAQGYLPASIVAPTLLGQPVVTAFFAVLLLGESFSAWHILGGILVLVGVYTVHRSRWKDTEDRSDVKLAPSVEESRQA
jgi:drug/metabolite transporter (DMT)-like permease